MGHTPILRNLIVLDLQKQCQVRLMGAQVPILFEYQRCHSMVYNLIKDDPGMVSNHEAGQILQNVHLQVEERHDQH